LDVPTYISSADARAALRGSRPTAGPKASSRPAPPRPLLKWAGGKRQLLATLAQYYPVEFSRYVEPFVGSGAVFFHLSSTGGLDGRTVHLSDVNPDLIGCYLALRDRPEAIIAELAALQREHRAGGEKFYYEVRDLRFNPRRATLMTRAGHAARAAADYPVDLAAMLIFLNRTGFNGLFRLNRHGEFNVPAGRYTEPRICDPEHLRQVAATFRRRNLTIAYQPFDDTLADSGAGDFVYCDPPYAPLTRTASFASYTADGFTTVDQTRLQQAVIDACRRGAQVVVSNSSAPEILEMYGAPDAVAAGLRIRRVPARRAINSQASARGPVDELIISNVKVASLDALRPRMAKARSKGQGLRSKASGF
jgi:DNA adenine methylase